MHEARCTMHDARGTRHEARVHVFLLGLSGFMTVKYFPLEIYLRAELYLPG